MDVKRRRASAIGISGVFSFYDFITLPPDGERWIQNDRVTLHLNIKEVSKRGSVLMLFGNRA
jgi:hypothetical protein